MKQVCILLFLTISFIGCVTSNRASIYRYPEINVRGIQSQSEIRVQVDSMKYDYDCDYVSVDRDSVRWIDSQTQQKKSSPIANLLRIRFSDSGGHTLTGAAFGAAPGAAALIMGSLLSSPSGGEGKIIYTGVMAIFAVVMVAGAGVGAITGALIRHKTDYIF